jgi:hypothetical protein
MFYCDTCNELSKKGEASFRKVIETREKIYPQRENAFKIIREGKVFFLNDEGGVGHEIVREITVCQNCV